MNRDPDPFDHPADALSEDLLAAPAERLVAEAAEDAGDSRAFAAAFDRVAVRAARQADRRQVARRLRTFATALVSRGSWRPAMASVAAVGVIAVAGDLYLHVSSQPMVLASAPQVARRCAKRLRQCPSLSCQPLRCLCLRPCHRSARSVAAAVPPAVASPSSVLAVRPPTDGPKGPRPVAAAESTAPAQSAVSDDRLPALLAQAATAPEQDTAAKVQAAPASPTVAARSEQPLSSALLSFSWPLRGPLLIGFGGADRGAPNDGIDVAVPVGTDIRAAADGVIVYAGGDGDHIKGFGKLIVVRHRDGFVTVYAYASRILVKPNDTVSRGQVIANSGRSGSAGEPKLHFEIRKGTAPVDPAQYLPPTRRARQLFSTRPRRPGPA